MKQKEVFATYAMLEEFKNGEDIEKIFNVLRPKYPIRKYTDILNYNPKMKKLTRKTITKKEIEVINDWLDFYECQKIRACFYGNVENEIYLKKAQILDNMFKKYDSFLDKREPIYRGIRFKKGFDEKRYKMFIKNIHNAFVNNEVIKIDEAPSSFTRNKDVAYKEFARVDSDNFYSVIFILTKRKNNELYIKEFAGKFAYQDEIVVKSHRSGYKIVNITKENEVLIVEVNEE